MNIYEFTKKAGLTLKAARKIEKLGVLKLDKENDRVAELVFHMRGNMTFNLRMLLWFLDDPALIEELGYASERYAKRARAQLESLGDIKATAAPAEVTAEIRQAGKGDDDAALVIAQWLIGVLPAQPVPYHWIAARLLAPLNEFMREQNSPMLTLALLGVRKLPEFAGYWRTTKSKNIEYFSKKELDL
jgi:hypothetical protein